ncbi:MAG: hypothetical protein JW725_03710 [Candidatus Babeliaceae bacterium]|nr:hypothetical protein [Candidatus Babeliaceae bacterium]
MRPGGYLLGAVTLLSMSSSLQALNINEVRNESRDITVLFQNDDLNVLKTRRIINFTFSGPLKQLETFFIPASNIGLWTQYFILLPGQTISLTDYPVPWKWPGDAKMRIALVRKGHLLREYHLFEDKTMVFYTEFKAPEFITATGTVNPIVGGTPLSSQNSNVLCIIIEQSGNLKFERL